MEKSGKGKLGGMAVSSVWRGNLSGFPENPDFLDQWHNINVGKVF
jgi:hypothetical protein